MTPTLAGLEPTIAAAVAHTTDAVVITTAEFDPPGPEIVYVNPAFCAMTGYTVDELLGRTPRILHGPATDRAELDNVRAALEQGRPYHGEALNYRKDGSVYHLRWHLDPIRDASGTITHWVAIQRDVTAAYQAAAERAQLLDTVQQALALRDQFLAVAAHELRTPLTALLGYVHLVPRAAAQSPDAVAALTEKLSGQVRRMTALIEQLLDVSHLQRGQFAVDLAPLDLTALAARVVDEFRQTLALGARHQVTLDRPDTALIVQGDAARLEEVLGNLLGNAVKYSPAGGRIEVRVVAQPDTAVVEVADQGIGIPPAAQARLWEPYFRAGGDGRQPRGFGLGLYIVQQIIQRHGGRVGVTSTEGLGSTFSVTLPRIEPQP